MKLAFVVVGTVLLLVVLSAISPYPLVAQGQVTCIRCEACTAGSSPGVPGHRTYTSGTRNHIKLGDDDPHACWPNGGEQHNCDTIHGLCPCGGDNLLDECEPEHELLAAFAAMPALRDAVRKNRSEEVWKIMTRAPSVIQLAPERAAIQLVSSCGEVVFAQYKLPAQMMAALSQRQRFASPQYAQVRSVRLKNVSLSPGL